jgi:predicted small secreted protein
MKNLKTSFLLAFLTATLSSCNVPSSFSYAFFGTAVVVVVAMVIAAGITKRGEGKH